MALLAKTIKICKVNEFCAVSRTQIIELMNAKSKLDYLD